MCQINQYFDVKRARKLLHTYYNYTSLALAVAIKNINT